VHESGFGTKRRFAVLAMFGRYRSKSGHRGCIAGYRSEAIDPSLPSAAKFCCDAQRGIPM
jgi:hypothetical protein